MNSIQNEKFNYTCMKKNIFKMSNFYLLKIVSELSYKDKDLISEQRLNYYCYQF